MSENVQSANRKIARAALVVMVGMALSSITGLLRNVMVTNVFGTGAEIDAFYTANRVTEILFNLMAGGALASAFVPTFTGFLTRKDSSGAWKLASAIINWVVVLLGLAAVVVWFSADWLVPHVFAPGFEDPNQIALTVELLRDMLLAPIIFGVSGLIMGILNAQQHFAAPALAPACYRGGEILGVLVLVPHLGIQGLAYGVVIGAVLHLAIQLPALWKRRGPYTFGLGVSNPAVRQVGTLMAPRLLGVAVVQFNFLVNTMIATGQPEGSLSAITWGFAIMIMPQTVIAQAIAIAALPTFSEQVSLNRLDDMRASLATTLRWLLYLSIPASVGLILLREPVVAMLFERGKFDAWSTQQVAWALLWYAAGLVGHSLLEIIVRAFYAMKDTFTPVTVGAMAMALNAGLSFAFAALFTHIGWMPHGGLALANSLATALECVILLVLLRKRLQGLDMHRLVRGVLATLGGTLAMGLAVAGWLQLESQFAVWLVALGGVLIGGLVYYLVTLAIGAPEARQLPAAVMAKLRRR